MCKAAEKQQQQKEKLISRKAKQNHSYAVLADPAAVIDVASVQSWMLKNRVKNWLIKHYLFAPVVDW